MDNSDGVSTLANSTISGNRGSGITQQGASSLTLTNSTISGNPATGTAGGVDNYIGDVIITNSTISGNSTTGDSGGVENYSGNATITNSTISRNAAARGGGIARLLHWVSQPQPHADIGQQRLHRKRSLYCTR